MFKVMSNWVWFLFFAVYVCLSMLLDSGFYHRVFSLAFFISLRVLVALDRKGSEIASVTLRKIGATSMPSSVVILHSFIFFFLCGLLVEFLIVFFDMHRSDLLWVVLAGFVGCLALLLYAWFLRRSENREAEVTA
ncbi:MAG: hypothetical protein ISN29_09000 [Gammaproteobacteria bacterium AqS3]|nr:hypothetical protein [Gammaproteobacteria bacterium AqS3]